MQAKRLVAVHTDRPDAGVRGGPHRPEAAPACDVEDGARPCSCDLAACECSALRLIQEVLRVVDEHPRHLGRPLRAGDEPAHELQDRWDRIAADDADHVPAGTTEFELDGQPAREIGGLSRPQDDALDVGRGLPHLGARAVHHDEAHVGKAAGDRGDLRVEVNAPDRHGLVPLARDECERVCEVLAKRRCHDPRGDTGPAQRGDDGLAQAEGVLPEQPAGSRTTATRGAEVAAVPLPASGTASIARASAAAATLTHIRVVCM